MRLRLRSDPLRRRWLLWATLGVVFLLVNVNRLSTAVLSEQLMVAFGTTGAQLGTLHAMFFWVYAVMQIPTGVLADRIGPRLTATAGAAVMNVGAIWFSVADGYLAALVARGLVGLGGSVIFVCILRFCANWYRADEFATMSGLTFAVSGVGGVLATTPLAIAVEAAGWRTTVGWLGIAGLAFTVLVFALVRDTPARAGFEPLEGVPEQPTPSNAQLRSHLEGVLRDPLIWVVSVMLFCSSGVNLTLFGLWGVPYVVQTYDVSVTYASVFTLLGGVGLMIGPPGIGWLSDRLERRVELMVAGGAAFTTALAVIAVIGDPPLPVVGVAFFLSGALLGAFLLGYAVVKDRHPDSASGISTGTVNGAGFFGAATLPTIMGWALDAYWTGELVGGVRVYTEAGYRLAFGIATAAGAVAFACTVWLYYREKRGATSLVDPDASRAGNSSDLDDENADGDDGSRGVAGK
ncbi:Sugar phosphate permease [Halobiforma haloterrestris]|uniref:Lysosomal dipeptide transporter MFSD1 n=1 Tax=Natronobacterium haloterrestre TaxID=148448 RepID=A0A1I1EE24_NATHA|nr:Sugar phosphate permease [Halobiforma haloterrestris]